MYRICSCCKPTTNKDICTCNHREFGGDLGGRPVLSLRGRTTSARQRWPTELWVFSWLAIFVFDCLFPWAQPTQKLASSRFFFRRALLTHPTQVLGVEASSVFFTTVPSLVTFRIYGGKQREGSQIT